MRYQPAHAATDPVPFVLRAPQSLRLALSAAVAATIGFVPVAFVASPAQAAPGDVDFDSDIEAGEADSFTFELRREPGSADPLTLTYGTVDGTATAGEDYTPISGTTSFPAGSTRAVVKRFTVAGLQDSVDEANETFILRLTGTVNGNPVTIDAEGILDDDDPTPAYSLTVPDPVTENAGNARVTATLTAASGRDVVIPISTAAGTATAGEDFTTTSTTITVPKGARTAYADVPILEDAFDEEDVESFTVTGATGGGGELNSGGALTVNVQDNDLMPTVGVTDPGNVTEDGDLDFEVTLSAPSNRTVTVVADTVDGSATAGADYTGVTTRTVTFAPGDTTETVTVDTQADALNEVNPETLSLRLSTPVHATAGDMTAEGGITDDDNPPEVSLSPATVAEGDTGPGTRTFTVSLDAPSGREVRIGYQVNGGTATAGEDFTAIPDGELVFAAGETTKTFTVDVLGDRLDETDETFGIVLSNPGATVTGAALGANTITVTDDDATPEIASLGDLTVAEGDAPAVRTVRLELTNPSAQPITFDVTSADDEAEAGGTGPGSDDFDLPSSTVTVPAGATGVDVPVRVNGDEVYEADETADLTVTTTALDPNVVAGTKTSTLTFGNDDDVPTVALTAGSGNEGDIVTVTATVTGVAQDAIPVTVTAAGASTGGSDAAQPADFDATGLTAVQIPGGNLGGPVTLGTIELEQDDIDEVNQTVGVTLTGIAGVAPAYVTITDDAGDLAPTVTPGTATAAEGDGDVDVPVTLDFTAGGNTATSTERTISAQWATADDTAEAPADYLTGGGTVTFTPGDTSETVTVDLADDQIFERDETFTVRLSSPSPVATPLAAASAVTITDDDSANKPTFEVGAPATAFREGSAGTADFTVQLDRVTAEPVTFDVVLDDDTATTGVTTPGGDDYATPVATVTVPAGQSSATVSVTVTDDEVYERAETATLRVTRAAGEDDAVGGEETATLSITDDDPMPTVVVNTAAAEEGAATVAVTGTVTGVTQDDIPVTVTAAGIAHDGSDPAEDADFDATGLGATVIPGGLNAGPVPLGTLALADDRVDENAETVRVTVSGLAADAIGWQTVTDDADDMEPTVSAGDVTLGEAGGPAEVPVTLDFGQPGNDATSTEKTVTVRYATADGSARAPGDYTAAANQTVTFTPGADARTIEVPVNDDTMFERTETFAVNLSSPVGATIGDGAATVTVNDDDSAAKPAFTGVADVEFTEGAAAAATFTVRLDRDTAEAVTFDVTMADDTATTGLTTPGGNDYTAPAATVTVQPNTRSATVTVPVTDDMVYERTEEATITVARAAGEDDATGGPSTATLRISDDDDVPTVQLNSVGGSEGTDITVIATVTGTAQEDMRLGGIVEGYGAGELDPAEDTDFTDNELGAYVPAGATSGRTYRMGTVTLNQDDIDEYVETVRVTVGDLNDVAANTTALYRISDDPNDLPPSVAISDETIGEGEESVDLTVGLTFDGDTTATEQVITVPWSTVNGTARSGLDYTGRNGTLTFEPGTTERTVNVPVIQDELFENDQTFSVQLGTALPRPTEVTKATGEVTIIEDDEPEAPTLAGASTRIGAGAVTLSGTTSEGTLVRLYAAPVSAPTAWKLVATTTAGSTGLYGFTRTLDRGSYFRTRANDLYSAAKLVRVYQAPTLAVTSTTRGVVSFTVTGNPALAGQAVTIQRLNANGVWSTVARGTTGSRGTLATTLRNQRAGATTFRAYLTADAQQGTLGGYSASRRITVR